MHEHVSRLTAQNRRCGAAEVLAVIDRADAGGDAEFDVWHLALAAFAANLPHGFYDVQHAASGRRLAAVDHATAGLDRQIALERKISLLEKCFVISAAKAQVLDLDHDDGDVIVIEIEAANIFVRDAGHFEGALARLRDPSDQRIGAIMRAGAGVVALAPTEQINGWLAHALGALG